ncbi:hypothetical protein ACFU99_00800 [Streptomyces sp. NPDC057654]|uniref:hypothetical protein n=1 Tax=Streptomyces sp. NPDC057654 TaxID=3346196 RepID=UPI0036BE504F
MSTREVQFYGPIGEAVQEVAPTVGVDPVGIYAASLSMWSMAISDKVFMDSRRIRSPLVSTVLVAGTGVGKNVMLRAARHIMEDSVGHDVRIRETSGITSGASLVDYLTEQMALTKEALGYEDKRVIVIDEEWKETLVTVARDRSYGTKIRQAWDCETLRNTRMRKGPNDGPQVVHSARVVFHSHITPEDWQQHVSLKEAAGGSYNRFLPVLLQKMPLVRNPKMGDSDTSALTDAFSWIRQESPIMELSKAADNLDWAIRRGERILDEILPPHQSVFVSRTAEQVRRVAALLACSVGDSVISREQMLAAASFVGHSIDSVKILTRDGQGSKRAPRSFSERVIAELESHPGGVPSAILQRRTGALASDLEHLAATGVITIDKKVDGPGRPTKLCRLNKGRPAGSGIAMSVADQNPFLEVIGL